MVQVPIDRIKKSTVQPRQQFDPEAMADLVASIRQRGVLQPLFVRRAGQDYELIAGERRLRAATEVGLKDLPAIVMEANDNEALLTALVENLQREDLNVLEEAEGYRMLATRFGLTQEQTAQQVGKSRSSVANTTRVLDLPKDVRDMLADNRLTPGHAKVLAGVEIPKEQFLLAQRVVLDGLSVRQLEKLVRKLAQPPRKPRAARSDIPADHLAFVSDSLHQHFGTAVRIMPCRSLANGKKAKGTIEIDFYSGDDLDRLLQIMAIEV
ncbi:MAG: ParB/RepB/Spo0J family partition protein [Verrucomicrobiota bacterium]|nr:ParB/RepB/Spo0J family partition protein [Verrucomicrobiota bacterium]